MKQISFSVNQKHIHHTVFEKYIGLKKKGQNLSFEKPKYLEFYTMPPTGNQFEMLG